MSKIIEDTKNTFETYILKARGIATRDSGTKNKGDEVDLVWSMVRGMTDNGQPAWDTFSMPIFFDSKKEAEASLRQHGSGWSFEMIKDSGYVCKRIVSHTTIIIESVA